MLNKSKRILVTGATGYVGGRLIPMLLEEGYKVRVLARHPKRLMGYDWGDQVEVVAGDAKDPEAVSAAVKDIDLVYYLLHSIYEGDKFDDSEYKIAKQFSELAYAAKVKRFIYLGGMIPKNSHELSKHLGSRERVGETLRASGVNTIELRAAVIIGSGSASFEMLRHLTERLPVMVTPKWLNNKVQPIAIRDVLYYLVNAAKVKEDINDHFDIGGEDILTYEEMMQQFAKVAKLKKRIIIRLPILTPKLSSLWINFVTPVPSSIARPLVESLIHEVIKDDDSISTVIAKPSEGLIDFDRAVELALEKVLDDAVVTRWSNASSPSEPIKGDPEWTGGSLYADDRSTVVKDPEALWKVIEGIGGTNGWYSFPMAWQFRGFLDRIFGGVGMRRGRRHASEVRIGDALDFWRVEEREQGKLLRLHAEMKVPGDAWLELRVEENKDGTYCYHQRATFRPKGLAGHIYWWMVWPFHGIVFGSMLKNISAKANQH